MKTITLLALFSSFLAWELALPAPAGAQSEPPICVSARSARARGSPAAAGLERQCEIALQALRPPPVSLGRVHKPADPFAGKPAVPLGGAQRPTPDPLEKREQRTVPLPNDDLSEDQANNLPGPPPWHNPDNPPWDPYGTDGQSGTGGNASAQICQVGGLWQLYQSNGTEVELRIEQQGSAFKGSGRFAPMGHLNGVLSMARPGTVEHGQVDGRDVSFRVRWTDGHIGMYKGKIGAAGVLDGEGYDFTNPSRTTKWYVSRNFSC